MWNLPLVRWTGKRNGLVDGWSLSGITRLSDGLDTPNYLPGDIAINTDTRNGQAAFNTSLFSLPSLGTLGTASRRFFYGPGMMNFDAALVKSIRIADTREISLRLEAFNVFNHAQFLGPAAVNGNITSATFGQIVSANPPRVIQLGVKFNF